eukprot:NODE_5032_length_608_cov_77.665474_g4342_i0.p2 GENE.NODE_5032_length_608_cov_77.665474_g4342_i0~~NODE_5032_length_608_cov_77.665474_g4342_i0.p2  ORF type:complete len:151 (-),score=55.86 NODE_5032_length_608_cov_77.665474_g4342_i0:128-580(-)
MGDIRNIRLMIGLPDNGKQEFVEGWGATGAVECGNNFVRSGQDINNPWSYKPERIRCFETLGTLPSRTKAYTRSMNKATWCTMQDVPDHNCAAQDRAVIGNWVANHQARWIVKIKAKVAGDIRFMTWMYSDSTEGVVLESESTHQYSPYS